MNSEQFVEALRLHVMDSAVHDTIANLVSPPGRRIAPAEKGRSDWFNALSVGEAEHVKAIVADAAYAAVFGCLASLDGARTISDEQGRFELRFVGRETTFLNPSSIDLHDLLSASK